MNYVFKYFMNYSKSLKITWITLKYHFLTSFLEKKNFSKIFFTIYEDESFKQNYMNSYKKFENNLKIREKTEKLKNSRSSYCIYIW